MNNQCVPSWDLEDTAGLNPRSASGPAHQPRGLAAPVVAVPMPEPDQYDEVAELTWEKGNIFWQGLLSRPAPIKYPPPSAAAPMHASPGDRREQTLEAVVGEAAARSSSHSHHLAPNWLAVGVDQVAAGVVPCAAGDADEAEEDARVRNDNKRARRLQACAASQGSAAAPGAARDSPTLLTMEPCGFTATTTNNSTSLDLDHGSPEETTENTSFGGGAASDSRYFSRRSQRDGLCDEAETVVIKEEPPMRMRSSISTKRSRAAAIHNESERKRRDRINQKMQTLQKLVPNSSKTDKASMLDEVIEHLKQLQAQVQMMSRMGSMMMPMGMAMAPPLQMSVMANMAQMAQMAQMGLGMMNMAAQPAAYPGLASPMNMMQPPNPFVPIQPWDAAGDRQKQPAGIAAVPAYSAFLACQAAAQQQQQAQPNGMEAYNRMVAMYQKLSQQQSQPGNSKQ